MALSKSSVLHCWSSRYGINPRIGGRPVFLRSSAGAFITQEGEIDTAIVNTPRFDWATLNLPNSQTERRKVLTLELARTNLMPLSEQFNNAGWSKTASGGGSVPVVTADAALAPDGTLSADKIVFAAPGGADISTVSQTIPVTNATAHAGALYLKASAAADIGKVLLFRHVGAAAYTAVTLTADWQRIATIETSTSTSGAIEFGLRPGSGSSSGTVTVLAWGADLEQGSFGTSYIKTPSTSNVSRSVDHLYWSHTPTPQAMIGYLRFIERGGAIQPGARLLAFDTPGADSNPQFLVFNRSNTAYTAYHHNGTSSVFADLLTAPAIGDTCELVFLLSATGQPRIIQSINGGAVSDSGFAGALSLSAMWGGTPNAALWLNESAGSGPTAGGYADVKVVKYADVVATSAQGIMDELRGFELGPNGDIL